MARHLTADSENHTPTSHWRLNAHTEPPTDSINEPQVSPEHRSPKGQGVVERVYHDTYTFLASGSRLFFNERDLQMHLALWLQRHSHHVELEYFVPRDELDNTESGYIWDSELRLDIVVRDGAEYVPIELKYKTRSVACSIERFGEKLDRKVEIVKNQGGHNIGMYHFWKDIRRVELVCKRFHRAVKGGLVVFVTNDPTYLTDGAGSKREAFSMAEGEHPTHKHWVGELQKEEANSYPAFEVETPYTIRWHKYDIDDNTFYFCIVKVGCGVGTGSVAGPPFREEGVQPCRQRRHTHPATRQ